MIVCALSMSIFNGFFHDIVVNVVTYNTCHTCHLVEFATIAMLIILRQLYIGQW